MKTSHFTPSYDNKIVRKFSARTLEAKLENKIAIQKELGWVSEAKIPLFCIPGGMTDAQGGKVFAEVLPGILSLNNQLIVRGIGSEEYGRIFTKLEKEYPHRVRILKDDDVSRRKMYAASDASLFFAKDAQELAHCLAYGAIPISPLQTDLADYNPVEESGNAFIADHFNAWTWFAAFVRASETYKLPYDFRTIQKHAMQILKEEVEV